MFICCLGLSYSAEKSVKLNDYVAESSDDEALVFVVSENCDVELICTFIPSSVTVWCLNQSRLYNVPGWCHGSWKD